MSDIVNTENPVMTYQPPLGSKKQDSFKDRRKESQIVLYDKSRKRRRAVHVPRSRPLHAVFTWDTVTKCYTSEDFTSEILDDMVSDDQILETLEALKKTDHYLVIDRQDTFLYKWIVSSYPHIIAQGIVLFLSTTVIIVMCNAPYMLIILISCLVAYVVFGLIGIYQFHKLETILKLRCQELSVVLRKANQKLKDCNQCWIIGERGYWITLTKIEMGSGGNTLIGGYSNMADGSKQSIITKNRIQPVDSDDEDGKKSNKPAQTSRFKNENLKKDSIDSIDGYKKTIENKEEVLTPNKDLIDKEADDFVEVEHRMNRKDSYTKKTSNINNFEFNTDPKVVAVGRNRKDF